MVTLFEDQTRFINSLTSFIKIRPHSLFENLKNPTKGFVIVYEMLCVRYIYILQLSVRMECITEKKIVYATFTIQLSYLTHTL